VARVIDVIGDRVAFAACDWAMGRGAPEVALVSADAGQALVGASVQIWRRGAVFAGTVAGIAFQLAHIDDPVDVELGCHERPVGSDD
jgi:hypothetical protein